MKAVQTPAMDCPGVSLAGVTGVCEAVVLWLDTLPCSLLCATADTGSDTSRGPFCHIALTGVEIL